jgi:outer membrane protein assembly factor BamB
LAGARDLGIRWWPALTIVVLAAAVLAWTWGFYGEQRQDRIQVTLIAGAVTFLALLIWLVLLSRTRRLVRVGALVALALAGIFAAMRLELRGFSGDIVPVLGLRGGALPESPETLAPPPPDAVPLVAGPSDYPQFLGPGRDGRVAGAGLSRDWSTDPPTPLWRQEIGLGWSAFAVLGEFAVTLEQRGEIEMVTCYEASTGRLRWHHDDTTRFSNAVSSDGPRATPTIRDGRVYALGGTGRLHVLDLATGRVIWEVDVGEEAGASIPEYGVSHSPLVLDDVVVVAAGGSRGGSLVAYDRETGERAWSGGSGSAAYSSPVLVELAGRDQILVFNQEGLWGHDPAGGEVLWNVEWPDGTQRVSQPVVVGDDRVFLSSGYGVGGKMFRVSVDGQGSSAVEMLWESLSLKAKFTNVVHRDGFLYGLDDGILACVDVETGERRWKGGRYGHGQIILAGDLLLVQAEDGDVFLVEAVADAHRELGRLAALDGKTWNHPALAGRRLLVRNDREAACYELPAD